jgi:hypothetical protein
MLGDYDDDGEVEIISADRNPDHTRLTSYDRVGGTFEPIATTTSIEPWFIVSAFPIEYRGQRALVRGMGSIVVLAWPSLELLYSSERGSPRLAVLGEQMVFISNWGFARTIAHGSVLNPDTQTGTPISTIVGAEQELVFAPDDSLMGTYATKSGRRTLAHLQLDEDGTPSVQLYRWPRGAQLLGALELDGDPTPELIGVRGRHVAIVDWRDGRWRWSAPVVAASPRLEVIGAFPLDDSPGIDIVLWNPAMLLSGCSGRGCTHVDELPAVVNDGWHAYLDGAGVLTWLAPQEVSQLRCGRSAAQPRGSSSMRTVPSP